MHLTNKQRIHDINPEPPWVFGRRNVWYSSFPYKRSLRTFDWTSQTRLEYNHLLEPSIKYSVFLPPSIKTLLISAVCLLLCHPFAVQPLEQVANDFSATLSVHHGSLINTPCVYTHLGKAAKVHHHAFLQVSAIHSKCFQSSCSLCLSSWPFYHI